MAGRDHRFRPNIVMRAKALKDLNLKTEEVVEVMTYFCEYIMDNMLLPGQVENWNMITDFNGVGVTDVPYSVLEGV